MAATRGNWTSFRGRRYYHGMRFLLVALCLLAAAAEKPAPAAPQKSTPAQPKKRRTAPTPRPPANPTRATEKAKTAMAAAAPEARLCGHDLDRTG